MKMNNQTCGICRKECEEKEGSFLRDTPDALKKYLKQKYPNLTDDSFVCEHDMIKERIQYVGDMMGEDQTEMNTLHQQVLNSIAKDTFIANDMSGFDNDRTFGQRVADSIAKFGGSWIFIFAFIIVLLVWIVINSMKLLGKPFDPYPFILLNLVLSCLAAIQAPVIMMSQNRQEARDREQSTNDYKVNLKSEIEIRLLHEKIDHMMTEQWQRLLEVQSIQVDLLKDLHDQVDSLAQENDSLKEYAVIKE